MAHGFLDPPRAVTGIEKVAAVGVAEAVRSDLTGDSGIFSGLLDGPLNHIFTDPPADELLGSRMRARMG